MKQKTHHFFAHLGALTAVLALLATPAFATDELVIYSGRSDTFVKPVVDAFSKKTGIEVILHTGKSTALLNKMRVENSRTQADLFISNDAGNLQIGADLDLFAPIPEALIKDIPSNMRADDNTWVGLSARARVLVVNKNKAAELAWADSIFDLADPRLKDRLAITHSANESYVAGVTVYKESAGEAKTKAWLQGMKDNVDNQVFNKHSKIVKAVARGQKDIGLVNHYYIYRHLDKHPDANIAIVLPDQKAGEIGIAWNVAGIAISKFSQHQKTAQRLVEFLVSAEGQQIFAATNREYPTLPGIDAAAELPKAGSYKVADVPMSKLGSERNATLDLIESVGMP